MSNTTKALIDFLYKSYILEARRTRKTADSRQSKQKIKERKERNGKRKTAETIL